MIEGGRLYTPADGHHLAPNINFLINNTIGPLPLPGIETRSRLDPDSIWVAVILATVKPDIHLGGRNSSAYARPYYLPDVQGL